MAKVVATAHGYLGGVIRETGDEFEWPEGVELGNWVQPAGGAKAKAKGKAVAAPTAKPQTDAAAHEVFGDAPAPENVEGNGLQAALGVPTPDWAMPGSQPAAE